MQRYDSFKNRLASLCKWYESHIQGFIKRTIVLYKSSDEQVETQLEEQAQWETRLQQTSERHEKLKSWRLEQIRKLQSLEQQMTNSMALQFEQDLKEAQKQKLERQKKKEKIQAYHERIDTENLKCKVIQEAREALELRAKQKQYFQNKRRINYRHQEWDNMIRTRKEKEQRALEEKLELEKRLDRLRAKVYVEAESNPDRLFQDTIAFSKAKECSSLKDQKLFKIIGFTHDQLMQDKRYVFSFL